MQTGSGGKTVPSEADRKPGLSSLRMFSKGRSIAFIKLDTQKWVRIDLHEVIYIEAREKTSLLFFSTGESMVCKNPLYKLERLLPAGFERIHRAYIVNVQWIDFVDLGKKQVGLKNEMTLSLGLAYKECMARYFINHSNTWTED